MIIARSPLRITLGGGGTDLPSYYEKFGGFLVAAAIDKSSGLKRRSKWDICGQARKTFRVFRRFPTSC